MEGLLYLNNLSLEDLPLSPELSFLGHSGDIQVTGSNTFIKYAL